jgi:hypothetical protein
MIALPDMTYDEAETLWERTDYAHDAIPPVRGKADVRQVAAFRLPVSVKLLAAMVAGLTREYGDGLTMRQIGDSIIIEQPNKSSTFGA